MDDWISKKVDWPIVTKSIAIMWLDYKEGLKDRGITRDLSWGVKVKKNGEAWKDFENKVFYVWFDAPIAYIAATKEWSENNSNKEWKKWWITDQGADEVYYVQFMAKDNIPFHTIIWPALIMGINASVNNRKITNEAFEGDLVLATNVSSNEYLMLQGGQFSKSRKHAVWLPSFLERYDADCLRYYLSINMPEIHDTDFRWEEFVDRVNNELIGTYGNFVHRVMTLTNRLATDQGNPLLRYDDIERHTEIISQCNDLMHSAMDSMERQRFKEALRSIMSIAQFGNQ